MLKKVPKLTVYSLCYNTGHYVIEGLESFRQCNFSDFQLVVLDDCSSDDSAILVEEWLKKSFQKEQFVFIRHSENIGISASMNEVLRVAQGEYFAGLCDDVWTNDRLTDLEFLENDPELGVLFCNAEVIDKDSKPVGKLYGNSAYLVKVDKDASFRTELYKGNFILPPACIYRTEVLKNVGGFDERLSFEDWDMFIRLAEKNVKMRYVDHVKVKYRQHAGSFWQSRSTDLFIGLVKFFEKHDLFKKTDAFVSYLEHFKDIPWRRRLDQFRWVAAKGDWKLSLIVLLNFFHAPSRLRFGAFQILFKPAEKAWSTSLS